MLAFHVWNPGFLAYTTTDFILLVEQSVTDMSEDEYFILGLKTGY